MKTIRVLPGENEDKFMELFAKFKFPENTKIRLGAIFGWPYNEADISDYDYDTFKEELDAINYIKKGEPKKMTIKERIKKFVGEHEEACVISVAIGIGAIWGAYFGYTIGTGNLADKIAEHKVVNEATGAAKMLVWIDEKVPDAIKLIDGYVKEHPDAKIAFGD